MPNYNLRRDRRRQKNTRIGARRWYKKVMHRFERRIAKIAIRNIRNGEIE
jgi:hypothetical protein